MQHESQNRKTHADIGPIRGDRFLTEGSSASHGILPQRSSSHGVTNLIQGYKEKERLSFWQNDINGTIELVPLIGINYGKIQVEFKIGGKKKPLGLGILWYERPVRRDNQRKYG